MPNFVSFDDGLSYINVSQIKRFGLQDQRDGSRLTVIEMLDGSLLFNSRPIDELAKMLDSVNAWY